MKRGNVSAKDERSHDEKRVTAWNEQSVTVTVRETVICNNAAGWICLSFKKCKNENLSPP
jgi:hypothetical protein